MPIEAPFKYRAANGDVKDGVLRLEDYDIASRTNMRTSGIVNTRFSDADPRFGSAFEQGMRSLGINVKSDRSKGILASSVREVLTGECTHKLSGMAMASSPSGGGIIVSPAAPVGGSTPSSRLFFPEVIMSIMDANLEADWSKEMALFKTMLASDESISSEVFTQPFINTTAPRSVRSTPQAQNALPRNMVSISASQVSKTIATTSVGLEISDQAKAATTLDLVGIILMQQVEGEALARLWEDLAKIVSGNVDAGESALTPVLSSTYDSGFTNGVVTQVGWLKMLWDAERKLSWSHIVGTIDDFLAIQQRTGRPVILDPRTTGGNVGDLGSYGLNVEAAMMNMDLPMPKFFLVPPGLWAAQNMLLVDARYALRRVTNTSATYAATEDMILQRSSVFRFDTGSIIHRLFGGASGSGGSDTTGLRLVDYS